ncbi:MAG: Uma2 family endonuclease [Crocosphaera sp.]|nr:Uma2 family endonuclease [Crocosphaera sp.]
MTVTSNKRLYTPQEYLKLEETSTEKHEYRNGEIILMTGGTTNHNKLAGTFYANLLLGLEDEKYEIYMGDVRLWIPRYCEYVYPDVMVVQGNPIYQSPGTTTITNPSLIVEVLSKSTKGRNRGDKFRYYRSIPQFKEYVLIDQYSVLVEHFVEADDGKWILTEYETKESILSLVSVQFQISLESLYKRVKLNEGFA